MTKKLIRAGELILFLLLLVSCSPKGDEADIDNGKNEVQEIEPEVSDNLADLSIFDFEFTDRDNEDFYSENGVLNVVFDGNSIKADSGIEVTENTVTLKNEGTYFVSGKTDDGMIIVDSLDTSKIRIILGGLELANKNGPAMYVKNADKVFITLVSDTENSLSDGEKYEYSDGETSVDGVIFSKADLTFNGSGALNVTANTKHGVVSKDDLVITGGEYKIKSEGVALCGKDCIKISKGTFCLNAGSDGLRSDNEEDADRGYIYISGGTFDIEAGNDGIQAYNVLKIEDGTFNIKCGGGSVNSSTKDNGEINNNWGFGGDDFGGKRPTMNRPMAYTTSTQPTTSESAKGIKSGSDIIIEGGSYMIDSSDDSVHSNGSITISGGQFDVSSGDDGIHADTALSVKDGWIEIKKSYEGLESSDVVISGGKINVVASDDGINAAGGNDGSATNGRPGMNGFSKTSGRISISGGYTVIDASGDGIDSNGTITVSGGVTLVNGANNSGNGALDYDGSAVITGGTFVAVGSSGMAQGFTSADNQGAISTNISSVSKGTSIALCDKDGKVVVSITPQKNVSHIVVSSGGIESNNTYTLVVGAEVKDADENGYAENTTKVGGNEISEINMTSNIYGSSGGMGGMGDMGGGRGPHGFGGRM